MTDPDAELVEAIARTELTPLIEYLDEYDRHPEVAAHLPALRAYRERN